MKAREPGSRYRRLPALAAIALLLAMTLPGAAPPAPARAEATAFTTTIRAPLPPGATVFIGCALAGAGELVALSGTIQMVIHVTTDHTGATHIEMHANPQGVTGTGLTSGDKYQGTGVFRGNFDLSGPPPAEFTLVDDFRIIGPGPGNNLLMHTTMHVTVNANGQVTANVSNVSMECK